METTSPPISTADIQDAYHYALHAARLDCAFSGDRDYEHTPRIEMLRMALVAALKGGLPLGAALPRRTRDAETFANTIRTWAASKGIDANTGLYVRIGDGCTYCGKPLRRMGDESNSTWCPCCKIEYRGAALAPHSTTPAAPSGARVRKMVLRNGLQEIELPQDLPLTTTPDVFLSRHCHLYVLVRGDTGMIDIARVTTHGEVRERFAWLDMTRIWNSPLHLRSEREKILIEAASHFGLV